MHTPFNPYAEWLGLTERFKPANYYELLGLDPRENDPEAIATAAKHLAARVRSIRPGPRLAEWQALLDEINEAKTCLLDPKTKAAYDKTLGGQAPAREQPNLLPRNAKIPDNDFPPDATVTQPGPGDRSSNMPGSLPAATVDSQGIEAVQRPVHVACESPAARAVSRRRRFPWQALIGLIAVALIFALGIPIGYRLLRTPLTQSQGDAQKTTDEPRSDTEEAVSAKPPETADLGPSDSKPLASPGSPPAETTPQQPQVTAAGADDAAAAEQPSKLAVDPQQQVAFREAVTRARTSLGERDPEAAAGHLATAATKAQTPEEEIELARLQTLKNHLEEFLRGIRQCVSRLQSGEEFQLGDTVVVVVEARADLLIVRAAGRNYRYRIEHIPHKLMLALAEQWFANRPSSRVLLGTYHGLDADGDREQARLLWQQAAIEGMEVEDLMPELAYPRDPAGRRTNNQSAATREAADEGGLARARDELQLLFQAEYDAATSPAARSALAEKLMARQSNEDDGSLRQAMLVDAREMAVSAGKAALALRAIDELQAMSATDSLQMKTSAMIQMGKNARGASSQRELAQAALQLIPATIEANRPGDALQLAEVAVTAAEAAGNASLLRRARTARQQLEARRQME